ncbi:hypothetical protein HMPREF0758_0269 [Serratia odorifera DSM 4582]|uniref:Uncharacterized protein n=1 Tax=Serratia odorifera DSM 4582 TaxID=667129 RepID=D4DWG9_SEROD|nr:hypothetical protein HMPREF0758_0269 [Serratia odorifera DSM 4582]
MKNAKGRILKMPYDFTVRYLVVNCLFLFAIGLFSVISVD